MGLFDAFGVGGGNLSMQVQSQQVQAGEVVYGAVTFTAGRRAQQITRIQVKLTCTRQVHQANGQLTQETREMAPTMTVSNAFTAQAGQTYPFQFQVQLPGDAYASAPNLVTWRLSASADIDNEIDPGAGVELTVFGQAYQPQGMIPMGGPVYAPQGAKDPYAHGKGDPYGKGDPNVKNPGYNPNDPYGKGAPQDPYGKGAPQDPYGKGAGHDPNDPYNKGSKGGGKY